MTYMIRQQVRRLVEILLAAESDMGSARHTEDRVDQHSHGMSEGTRVDLCKLLVDLGRIEKDEGGQRHWTGVHCCSSCAHWAASQWMTDVFCRPCRHPRNTQDANSWPPNDGVGDAECGRVFTGPDFGCIHWERKAAP